jgi:hypothetical protein
MNTRPWYCGIAIGTVLLVASFAQEPSREPAPSTASTVEKSAPPTTVPTPAAAPTKVTAAETLQKLGVPSPRYTAHPEPKEKNGKARVTAPTHAKIVMDDPPPAPRAETKPPAPPGNYVWVPGHYVPINHEWRWVAGEWGVPVTPSSVWIDATYDAKTRTWSPGYWQPDRADSY